MYSTGKLRKVAVLGAAGGIGQPLSLLLKSDAKSRISDLALYDIANMGMAADLAHIPTASRVKGFSGEGELPHALDKADVVIIPAGVPRKPGMTRDDLFNINASIVRNLVAACAKYCPSAHVLIISNPVNSTVPIAYETMKSLGVAQPNVFGVTTLDIIRARTFIAEMKGLNPTDVTVKVVGGHSGPTIVPILSTASVKFTEEESKSLVQRIQYGGDEVVKAKAGAGSATLSMAFAAKEFYDSFVAVIDGVSSVNPVAFVKTDAFETGYFASEVKLGPNGSVKSILPENLSPYEKELLKTALADLAKDIRKGEEFARSHAH
ncbi:Malate dehydrogenase [Paramicrosporidium saccamoebae]|uniref:Malate dehydrogenase n=1 Tax=Paramicrosporidium saccamoebae TaxID=1246581 RepID=A0A2H9TFQ9_9FUNG|nr:Malate dehydrogenase [Paramicrosporidium saccamoebae]